MLHVSDCERISARSPLQVIPRVFRARLGPDLFYSIDHRLSDGVGYVLRVVSSSLAV